MEIGPIAAVRIAPTPKARKSGSSFEEFLDIEHATAPSEDAFPRRGERETPGGQDDDAQDDNLAEHVQEQPVEEAGAGPPGSSVNLFA